MVMVTSESSAARLRELLLLLIAEAAAVAVRRAPDEATGIGDEDGGLGNPSLPGMMGDGWIR